MTEFDGLNAGYATALLHDFLENPEAVPEEWRELLAARATQALAPTAPPPAPAAPAAEAPPAPKAPEPPSGELLAAVAAATSLVDAYRMHGHLAAHLDPLGSEPIGDPELDASRLSRLPPELQRQIPAALLGLHVPAETLADALPLLEETYCGTMAYEIEHISDHEERRWLRWAIESGEFRKPLTREERRRLLQRLSSVEAFEEYLRRAFLGQKQFSVEGLDALVPMMDEAVELAARGGAHEVVVGMAHRGRLSVLAHTLGQPYEAILREFEGERVTAAVVGSPEGGTGDVKYHLGAQGTRETEAGTIAVTLVSNPSHLEAVNPVVEGWTRAKQTDRSSGGGRHDPSVALPVLIHGDASFAGQGVVAETFNFEGLAGYSTGGTLHVIANNQVGFTTDPAEGRSTRYSSDLAKGFDAPIVHVNADDAEAAVSAVRLALAFRARFGHDVVVDLVGYRRFGHNEQDEPAYTQPLMAQAIAEQPTVRAHLAERLIAAGEVTAEEAERMVNETTAALREAHERLREALVAPPEPELRAPAAGTTVVVTSVAADRLRELDQELVTVPERFEVHPKLARQLDRRAAALDEGGIDWGHAEALAFGSLVVEGIPVRLTGQDTERGTFSHRHLVLHDATTGERYAPIQHLAGAEASIELHNSPLSEYGALGFEYGYSVAAPETLVLWEAQFGDFVNVAQVIIDQFLVSGLSKWNQTSRLTLLLPHGYEGNGPEHSSARLERFLQSAAQENIRVANPSTAAQYFHLLRRQALDARPRPLVAMTPKGLLRLADSAATLEELATGSFSPVLDDPAADHGRTRTLVLCSGKVYYDIAGHETRAGRHDVSVIRIDQLYPFPAAALSDVVETYPALDELVWAQEEPLNMGAYRSIRHRLEDALPAGVRLRYVGRPWRASPSEGYPTAHLAEQERIVRKALGSSD
ncbi:MAG TPA: 2-oxoglutarate dehydrogenase E1 component [Gaiellaceae bacterium]|nr:2-oxoglutarate dehydrogenase E1 component [Gaiellaceae bacterium]